METTELTPRRGNSQTGSVGAIISILLILAIVVAGAYYAFTDRTSPTPVPSEISY